jgi:hypothetical protein
MLMIFEDTVSLLGAISVEDMSGSETLVVLLKSSGGSPAGCCTLRCVDELDAS